MERITSRSNPLITHIRRLLRDRSYRREQGEFVCDGVKLLGEALRWRAELTAVLCTGSVPAALPEHVRAAEVPESLMASLSPMKAPQGALFTCRMPNLCPPERLEGRTFLLLDGLQDPGNVGTIWRSADAFGASGLLLTGSCADPFSWKAARASMGAVFRLPVWELEYEAISALCRRSDLPLYGAALREDTMDLRELSHAPCVIAVGSEGSGLSDELLSRCRATVKIPMEPTCESLNAAMAATTILWERYRSGK